MTINLTEIKLLFSKCVILLFIYIFYVLILLCNIRGLELGAFKFIIIGA